MMFMITTTRDHGCDAVFACVDLGLASLKQAQKADDCGFVRCKVHIEFCDLH